MTWTLSRTATSAISLTADTEESTLAFPSDTTRRERMIVGRRTAQLARVKRG